MIKKFIDKLLGKTSAGSSKKAKFGKRVDVPVETHGIDPSLEGGRIDVRLRRLPDSVLVTFSDGNLIHVAKQLQGDVVVFADNDASGAGERAARASGFPWVMAPTVGDDANDAHKRSGLFRLAALMAHVQEAEAVT